jgi:hypothetical protein
MTQREQVLIKYMLDVLDKHIEEENCSHTSWNRAGPYHRQ